jgi:manganese/zinc/iron transport system substrate-binding protein
MNYGRFILLFAFFALGCDHDFAESDHRSSRQRDHITIVCTTGMVADLVRYVGGQYVEVKQLMGQDVDPHLFKVSWSDIRLLRRADIVFYSGLHLEGKMAEVLEKLSRKRCVVALADSIEEEYRLRVEGGAYDPHVWFDVFLWSKGVPAIRNALMKFDPGHASEYERRSDELCAELTKLHTETRERIVSIPRERRVLVTAHDAFRYFGRAYDIEVKSIQGISTEAEASVKDINELVDYIVRRGIKAVFVETSVNQRNMRSVLEGCRARGQEVVIGGSLYSDAMGPEGTSDGTYVGMVRHNVTTIVQALK